MKLKHIALLFATVWISSAPPASAMDKPAGNVVLTISGNIGSPNVGKTAQFDMAMLNNLPGRVGTMETPWTGGSRQFSGPLLKAVLDAAGANGTVLKVVALNDYSADVPIEDATTLPTMLATTMDGRPMSVRDKGPLFLIYPFDLQPEIYNEKYFSRSVWQIKAIEVQK